MALVIGGVDVASLKIEDFPTPQERDAFGLGILRGLEQAAAHLINQAQAYDRPAAVAALLGTALELRGIGELAGSKAAVPGWTAPR